MALSLMPKFWRIHGRPLEFVVKIQPDIFLKENPLKRRIPDNKASHGTQGKPRTALHDRLSARREVTKVNKERDNTSGISLLNDFAV